MKKEQRLFIKNVPERTTVQEIEATFSKYGKVVTVDIKERKNSHSNQTKFFAYVNIKIDDSHLQKCFNYFTNNLWHEQNVELEIAKPNFLERLKQEREESDKSSKPKKDTVQMKDIVHDNSIVSPKKIPKNNICSVPPSNFDKPKKVEHRVKKKSIENEFKGDNLLQSEIKRVESVNQMIKLYRQQKSAIKIALSNVDYSKSNNKIIFDEYNDTPKINNNSTQSLEMKNGGNQLFESDEESEHNFNFEVNPMFEGNKGKELLELQSRYKNDKRFQLNERFLNDEEDNQNNDNETDTVKQMSIEEEKKKQFEILEEVLGKKIKKQISKHEHSSLHKGMLRYDPTYSDHLQYEITKTEKPSTLKRKKKEEVQVDENNSITEPIVSKNVFYKVSDELKETIQTEKGFSLLNLYGNSEEVDNHEEETEDKVKKITNSNLGANPFRYDSSDDEEPEELPNVKVPDKSTNKTQVNLASYWSEPFFFRDDDFRLQEGFDFMKRMVTEKKSEFMQVRKNLKEIVKAKVRNNQRKNRLFKKKLGGNKKKKNIRIKKALKK